MSEADRYRVLTNLQLYPSNIVRIYNLSGQLVYCNHHKNSEWISLIKGEKGVKQGIYIYQVSLDKNSIPLSGKVFIK